MTRPRLSADEVAALQPTVVRHAGLRCTCGETIPFGEPLGVHVHAPTACGRCEGSGVVGTVTLSWCPDCRCVECGTPTAGVLCDDHWAADWLRQDDAFRRAADV